LAHWLIGSLAHCPHEVYTMLYRLHTESEPRSSRWTHDKVTINTRPGHDWHTIKTRLAHDSDTARTRQTHGKHTAQTRLTHGY